MDHGEEYVVTFPSGFGRSILTVPWVELGGKVSINCPQTGYIANIEFKCKQFFSSDVNKVMIFHAFLFLFFPPFENSKKNSSICKALLCKNRQNFK